MAWSGVKGLRPWRALLCRGNEPHDRSSPWMDGSLKVPCRLWPSRQALAGSPNARRLSGGRLPQSCRNVATVHGRDVARRFQGERVVQKGLGHVFGGDFPTEQIAGHIGLFA
jgi:hypothetical protein